MKTITVLGNNSGRNAGDNAILGNLLHDFSQAGFNGQFKIPTINTRFISSTFGNYNVKPVSLMPWNLAIRNFGLPMYRAMTQTDLVLITDNILFDKHFHNPLFNNLKSISIFSRFCKMKGVPIFFYNASVGPIHTKAGARALQKVLDASILVITRDEGTKELINNLNLHQPEILVHADSALNTKLPDPEEMNQIAIDEKLFQSKIGTIGFNINAYIGSWGKGRSQNRKAFCDTIADVCDKLIDRLGVDILFTVTQIMDIPITRQCADKIRNQDNVRIIDNQKYDYHQIAGVLSKVDVHIGLRTHSLIFAALSGTPMISLNAYPKSVAFLETIGMQQWNINLDKLASENLLDLVLKMWDQRFDLRKKIGQKVAVEKEKARYSAKIVLDYLSHTKIY